jgi:hypothetical protein
MGRKGTGTVQGQYKNGTKPTRTRKKQGRNVSIKSVKARKILGGIFAMLGYPLGYFFGPHKSIMSDGVVGARWDDKTVER